MLDTFQSFALLWMATAGVDYGWITDEGKRGKIIEVKLLLVFL